MRQIHKEYARAFLLEPTKLIRLMGIIHEQLGDHQNLAPNDSFEVFLVGERREEMNNLDDVLKLDNSRKRRIQRLLIVSSVSISGTGKPDREVHVDFGSPKGNSTVVAIGVRSDNAGWADRTLSEIEDQVDRTWLPYASPVLSLIGILLLSVLLVTLSATQLGVLRPERQIYANAMWLKGSDLDRAAELVRDRHTLTDQELRELVTAQLRNVLADERPPQPEIKNGLRQALLIAVPLVVIIACTVVLFANCYPSAVFLWGDEDKRWSATQLRRKAMWSIIGTILVGGLLANGFYQGIGGLWPSK